jgi:DNA-binding response OmpR family regulator
MSKARILIVEDEFLVAANLEAILAERGYEPVGVAPDLKTALDLAAEKPDLALVDINLRDGETGPQIAERLCRDYGVAVVFVTANPRLAPANTQGMIGVLEKPWEDEVIGAAVDYALQARAGQVMVSPPAGLRVFDASADG